MIEYKENQDQLREIDRQRKIDDPTFKGAFHEKRYVIEQRENRFKNKRNGTKNAKNKGKGVADVPPEKRARRHRREGEGEDADQQPEQLAQRIVFAVYFKSKIKIVHDISP